MKPNCTSKPKVAILYGGRSIEHEISILTALQAYSAIDPCRYDVELFYWHPNGKFYVGEPLYDKGFYRQFDIKEVTEVALNSDPSSRGFWDACAQKLYPVDIYFLCFHGQYGEDGCIQGLLELKQATYTGCNLMASSLSMNKYFCKIVAKEQGLPVLPQALVKKREAKNSLQAVQEAILKTPGLETFPLFVKPCHLGSSVGISKADDEASLQAALAKVFYFDDEALVEPCLNQLMELNISVLEGEPPVASIIEMPVSSGSALSYEDKYLRGGSKETSSQGMASLTRVIDPAIDPALKQKIAAHAVKAFSALGCGGVVRFDFMLDLSSGQLYFNELNPIPGSLSFYLWEASTPPFLYTEVIDHLLERACTRRRRSLSLSRDLGAFKALS